jgi:hypothetical protein
MSWWKEEKIANKKNITIRSFNVRLFLILLAMGMVYLGLMIAARLLQR